MRRPLRLTLLLAGLLGAGISAARAADVVVVLNSGDADMTILDRATMTEIRRQPALREPHHWTLTPDGRELIVGDTVGNALIFLNPATGEILRRLPIVDPYQLGFSPDGKMLVVNALARNQVDVYEAGTYKLLKRFPLKSMPSHLVYSPDSSRVFITLQGSNKLAAIDLRKMDVLWNEKVGDTPAGVVWQNGKLIVANMGSDDLSIVDPATGAVTRRIKVGKGTHQLFLSPDKKILYVNSRISNTTTALDANSLAVIREYKVPGGPDDIDFAPDGKLWITQRFAAKVAVLDPATGAVQSIGVGRSPHGIYLSRGTRP